MCCGFLKISRITTRGAVPDIVFARVRRHHEFVRLRASHSARMRLDNHVLQTAPVENLAISVVMLVVGGIQARGIDVEGIRILHNELAYAQQSRSSRPE